MPVNRSNASGLAEFPAKRPEVQSVTLPRRYHRRMIDLPDDMLMLIFCIHPERLADPARWCNELRSLSGAADPRTSQEAEELTDRWARLRKEAGR